MKLLNLCCGSVRPQSEEWINVDNLHAILPTGSPERENLDRERNYLNQDLERNGGVHLAESVDGIVASHCFEHWDCQMAVRIMQSCHFYLKPGGILLVSVPDASYFRRVHDHDTVESAERLFGEPIHLPDGETTFFGYGLWNRHHKAILTEDALWAYFVRAGFNPSRVSRDISIGEITSSRRPVFQNLISQLNRIPFSLVMMGVKG